MRKPILIGNFISTSNLLGAMFALTIASGCGEIFPAPTPQPPQPKQICSGIPDSCQKWEFLCSFQPGCTMQAPCIGVAKSCALITSISTCIYQDGCTWNSAAGGYCTGASTSCSKLSGSLCTWQQGCTAQDACIGTPTPCSTLSADKCWTVSGCKVLTL